MTKSVNTVAVWILALVCAAPAIVGAQQPSPPRDRAEDSATPLKVQIVLSRFQGEKKVSSMPFTLAFNVLKGAGVGSLRMGSKIPIKMLLMPVIDGQKMPSAGPVQYQDVGTNIDCRAWRLDEGRYKLTFNIERSSVYSPDGSAKAIPANTQSPLQPVLRRYRGSFDLLLRDGQTADGPIATDPQSGRVLKTEVSLKVTR